MKNEKFTELVRTYIRSNIRTGNMTTALQYADKIKDADDAPDMLATIYTGLGDPEKALEIQHEQLSKALEQHQNDPENNPGLSFKVIVSAFNLGNAYLQLGRTQDAALCFSGVHTLSKMFRAEYPDDAEVKTMHMVNCGLLANFFAQQQAWDEGYDYFMEHYEIASDLLRQQQDPDIKFALAMSHMHLGCYYLVKEGPEKALQHFLPAYTICEELINKAEHHTEYEVVLSAICEKLGVIYEYTDNMEQALLYYNRFHNLAAYLHRQLPEINVFLQHLIGALMNLGILHAKLKHIPEALQYFNECREYAQSYKKQFPALPDIERIKALTSRHLGDIYADTGDYGQAETAYLQALDYLGELDAEFPDNGLYQYTFAHSHYLLSFFYEKQQRHKAALKHIRHAQLLCESSVKAFPTEKDHQELAEWVSEFYSKLLERQ